MSRFAEELHTQVQLTYAASVFTHSLRRTKIKGFLPVTR
jgi:hypothetical protein